MATVAEKEALGLSPDASEEDIMAAIESLKDQADGGDGVSEGEPKGVDALGEAIGRAIRDGGAPVSTETRRVTVAHKAFSYRTLEQSPTDPNRRVFAERLARRSDKIDVLEDDYQRGLKHDAFETDKTRAQRAAREIDIDDVSDGDLIRLIKDRNLTVNQTIALSKGDPEKARRLLKAENGATGNDPRDGVVKGLTAVLNNQQ